jgi:GH15 family glucan-1,4-alpha-glucosidase
MAWVGLDRLIKLAEAYNWKNAPLEKFRKIASAIYQEVERYGFNEKIGAYTREFNGKHLDASILVLPLVDFCDSSSPRMISTTKKIREQLSKDNLVYRYKNIDDGLAGGEGAFGICNFWLAENLAKSGAIEDAVAVFDATLKHASPAGLLSEEIDPDTHELLGNYPQGFTHIGLINAAISINEAYAKMKTANEHR